MEWKTIEDDDINLWHRIFHNKVCSQISTKESEIAKYNLLKNEVQNMKVDLEDYALKLNNTYIYTKSGISCVDFDLGIEKINEYSTKAKKSVVTVEGIIQQIDNEIDKLYSEISTLKKSIGI